MPTVVIANLQSKTIHCDDKRERLLDILLSATDWMHACGGKGRCTSCKARVIEGKTNLTPTTRPEEQYRKLNKLREDERLTCQVFVNDNIKIEVPEETKLPHITYSE